MRRLALLVPVFLGCAHGPRPVEFVPAVEPTPPLPTAIAPDEAFVARLRAFEPHALQPNRRPFGDLPDPFEWVPLPHGDRAATLWLIDQPAIVATGR